MLYKKDIYKLIGMRGDCFVPTHDSLSTGCHGERSRTIVGRPSHASFDPANRGMFTLNSPLERGRGGSERWQGCVFICSKKRHTPAPLSRGESHNPVINIISPLGASDFKTQDDIPFCHSTLQSQDFKTRKDVVLLSFGLSVFQTCGLAFSFLLLAFTFSSCSLNPNLQGKGETYIQGEWQQDSSAVQQKLVTASQYHAKFDCDSFYVAIKNFSKVNYGSDTCMRSGHWAEYIKGTYRQRNDTLFLKGQFCNANFTLKTNTDCFRVGPYEEFFKISKKTDSLIQLSGTSSIIPVNLHLLKRTSCTQKPL